ncbi:hypothetical protein FACS189491_07490 [Spirochaetia bacterium]|nr:hypothetical protein FACS189491_07490 [Spirochaetia bacterium]
MSNTFIALNAATENVQISDPLLGVPKSAIESRNLAALRTIINDFLIQAITSTNDLNAMYNQMIGVWESEGGLDTINDLNAIYAAWKK